MRIDAATIDLPFGAYVLHVAEGRPRNWPQMCAGALVESFDEADAEDGLFVAVSRRNEAPFLAIFQSYSLGPAAGFRPSVLLLPEDQRLFIGAGCRVLVYDLASPRRLAVDEAEFGFWGWARRGDIVLMAAELEFAAFDVDGRKRWTTFVEPPWTWTVAGEEIRLDVMGTVRTFGLRAGPPW